MDEPDANELLTLCRRYLKAAALPRPLPQSQEDYAGWRERVSSMPAADEDAENAWHEVGRLAFASPSDAWRLIRQLVRDAKTEDELGTIGAGVLETFVRYSGTAWADEIEPETVVDAKFRYAMQTVRCVSEHPELQRRISALLG